MDWLGNVLILIGRALLSFVDKLVYTVMSLVYNLFIQISDTGIFNNDIYQKFSTRIYSIIGIIMLFKLAFSLISYIVNPDDFTSKEKGMGKIVTNIMVVLVLIVITPTIFREAFNIQRIIIKENIIGQIVLGDVLRNESSNGQVEDGWYERVGNEMAFTIASAFVTPVDPACQNIDWNDDSQVGSCRAALTVPDNCDPETGQNCDSTINGGKGLYLALYNKDAQGLFSMDVINAQNNGKEFIVDYMFIISTIAGGITTWVFFIFCFDIAIRTVKLAFMQLIAPIPIISYLDPKSGKNGIFSKWLKQSISAFIDVFLRIAVIYFAIFVISQLSSSPMYQISSCDASMNNCTVQSNIFVKVFIIIGVLMFANKLPEIIKNMFGVDLGGFTLNPMKKIGQSPFAAALVGGALGGLGGAAANTAALVKNIRKDGFSKTFFGDPESTDPAEARRIARRNLFTTAGGFVGGMRGGATAGLASGGKGSAWKAAVEGVTRSSNARNLRSTGYGIRDKIRDKATDAAGIKTDVGTSSILSSKVKAAQEMVADSKMKERAMEEQKNLMPHRLRSDVSLGELNYATHFGYKEDPNDRTKRVRDYDYDIGDMFSVETVDGKDVTRIDAAKLDEIYSRYSSDASARGIDGAHQLTKDEFRELMILEKQSWDQDLTTKKLEKELKAAQEDAELSKPPKK